MLRRNLDDFSSLFWGPWSDFDNVSSQLDRLLQGTPYQRQGRPLPVNVWNGDDGAIVTAQMAGLKPDSIDVSLDGRELTVRCERPPVHDNGHRTVRQEMHDGQFSRTVNLAFDPDVDGIEAKYSNGQIEICVPKAESAKPRRIEIEPRAS